MFQCLAPYVKTCMDIVLYLPGLYWALLFPLSNILLATGYFIYTALLFNIYTIIYLYMCVFLCPCACVHAWVGVCQPPQWVLLLLYSSLLLCKLVGLRLIIIVCCRMATYCCAFSFFTHMVFACVFVCVCACMSVCVCMRACETISYRKIF